MDEDRKESRSPERDARAGLAARYGGLTALVAVVALAGYAGYALFPRFDLPGVQGAGLIGLAAAAGVASFFSPCSFPLLVTLLARPPQRGGARGGVRPLAFGGALALGAATFMILVGLGISLGGEALFAEVTFGSPAAIALRATAGSLLILLGLIQTGVLSISFHGAVKGITRPLARVQARLRQRRPVAGYVLFGFGYVLAGFG